tara:strand:- start:102 stop:872 length:771 start_codon:yes stop_codon:yes gene_type:complete
MNILDEIIVKKKERLEIRKGEYPLHRMQEGMAMDGALMGDPPKYPFKNSLIGKKKAIIAEIKKASPSAGIISKNFDPIKIARRYKKFGASALSILTEEDYFLGKIKHLRQVKWHSNVNLPILRKDFIFDKYQIWESKRMGSDCILLIASILNDKQLEEFAVLAEFLQLDYIIEVHDEEELKRVENFPNAIIGVNNRNLKTFKVDIQNSIRMRNLFKKDNIFIAESGIKNQKDIDTLVSNGIHVFLIGESLMKGDFF